MITDESKALDVSYLVHVFRHNGPPSMEDTNRPGRFGPAFFVRFKGSSGFLVHITRIWQKNVVFFILK
jgi:hypothetical protein